MRAPDRAGVLAPKLQNATFRIGAPVAQLDRVPGYEPGGREFESLRARQFINVSIPMHALKAPSRTDMLGRVQARRFRQWLAGL